MNTQIMYFNFFINMKWFGTKIGFYSVWANILMMLYAIKTPIQKYSQKKFIFQPEKHSYKCYYKLKLQEATDYDDIRIGALLTHNNGSKVLCLDMRKKERTIYLRLVLYHITVLDTVFKMTVL